MTWNSSPISLSAIRDAHDWMCHFSMQEKIIWKKQALVSVVPGSLTDTFLYFLWIHLFLTASIFNFALDKSKTTLTSSNLKT